MCVGTETRSPNGILLIVTEFYFDVSKDIYLKDSRSLVATCSLGNPNKAVSNPESCISDIFMCKSFSTRFNLRERKHGEAKNLTSFLKVCKVRQSAIGQRGKL